jgi:hypothetical protein
MATPTSWVNLPLKFLAHKIIKSHPKSNNNAPIEMEQDTRVYSKILSLLNKMETGKKLFCRLIKRSLNAQEW